MTQFLAQLVCNQLQWLGEALADGQTLQPITRLAPQKFCLPGCEVRYPFLSYQVLRHRPNAKQAFKTSTVDASLQDETYLFRMLTRTIGRLEQPLNGRDDKVASALQHLLAAHRLAGS